MTARTWLLAPLVALALGCASDSAPDRNGDETPEGSAELDGRCDVAHRIGGFEVGTDDQFTTVTGQVKASIVQSIFLEDIGATESCRLIRRTNPFCDPACTSPDICSVDMKCVPAPVAKSVGTVQVTGLAAGVSMEPAQPGSRYFFTKLPHPGMVAGQTVALTAAGADLSGFSLHGEGVDQVELPEGAWTLERGQPIELAWTPGSNAEKTRVRATLNIDQHGATPVTMQCEFPDSGAGTIAAELVDGLLDAGISGFPNGNVYRETADKVELAEGCVDFVVFAHAQRELVAAGHIPCKTNAECKAAGLVCDLPSESCR